jgi:trehalose 6-phosphate phosphatase
VQPEEVGADLTAVVAALAEAERLVVGCDFDGTLAPIVGDPAAARAMPGGLTALAALADLPGTEVALISGRSRADLIALAGTPAGVLLIGSHGGEWGSEFGEAITAEEAQLLNRVIGAVTGIVADEPGALVETKPGSVAVHVRRASRAAAARILAEVAEGPADWDGVATIAGKEVLELSVVHATKGAAIATLQERFGATATAYLGDDTTDETVFAMLGRDDAGFKVGPGQTAARYRLPGPPGVVGLLAHLAEQRRAATARRD